MPRFLVADNLDVMIMIMKLGLYSENIETQFETESILSYLPVNRQLEADIIRLHNFPKHPDEFDYTGHSVLRPLDVGVRTDGVPKEILYGIT